MLQRQAPFMAPDGAEREGQMEESDFPVKQDDGRGKVMPKPCAPRWDSR